VKPAREAYFPSKPAMLTKPAEPVKRAEQQSLRGLQSLRSLQSAVKPVKPEYKACLAKE